MGARLAVRTNTEMFHSGTVLGVLNGMFSMMWADEMAHFQRYRQHRSENDPDSMVGHHMIPGDVDVLVYFISGFSGVDDQVLMLKETALKYALTEHAGYKFKVPPKNGDIFENMAWLRDEVDRLGPFVPLEPFDGGLRAQFLRWMALEGEVIVLPRGGGDIRDRVAEAFRVLHNDPVVMPRTVVFIFNTIEVRVRRGASFDGLVRAYMDVAHKPGSIVE